MTRLPCTISRRSLRKAIRREIEAGVLQKEIARRAGLSESRMSLTMKSTDRPSAAWTRIAACYGYAPSAAHDHLYIRPPTVAEMRKAA